MNFVSFEGKLANKNSFQKADYFIGALGESYNDYFSSDALLMVFPTIGLND